MLKSIWVWIAQPAFIFDNGATFIDWVKILAFFWGVETIYYKVISEPAFQKLQEQLRNSNDILLKIKVKSDANVVNEEALLTEQAVLISTYEGYIEKLKFFSRRTMLFFPSWAMVVLFFNITFIRISNRIFLPNFLINYAIVILLYSLYYVLRLFLTYHLVHYPENKYRELHNNVEYLHSKLEQKAAQDIDNLSPN